MSATRDPMASRVASPADIAYATRRRDCAYWYAVGWSDATGQPDIAQEFGEYARVQAESYRAGEVCSLPSVTDQWRTFTMDHKHT